MGFFCMSVFLWVRLRQPGNENTQSKYMLSKDGMDLMLLGYKL